uniref:Uncharacterized protein n=1 Tax=Caenorhabditis japonica TaxID=281687 RepID=A0A8R1EDF3_CAEJA
MAIVSITIAASISMISIVSVIRMMFSCFIRPPDTEDDYDINPGPSDYFMLDSSKDASDLRRMILNCQQELHQLKSSNDVMSLD